MSEPNTLKRSLGLPMLTLYGLGTIVGGGFYALVGGGVGRSRHVDTGGVSRGRVDRIAERLFVRRIIGPLSGERWGIALCPGSLRKTLVVGSSRLARDADRRCLCGDFGSSLSRSSRNRWPKYPRNGSFSPSFLDSG